MDDSFLVCGFERSSDLPANLKRVFEWHRTLGLLALH
jgi:hypothetical protein